MSLRDAPPDASGWGVAAGLRYLEIVRGGASAQEPLPMLLVIHGLGDKPDRRWLQAIDVAERVKARMILPQAPTPHASGFSWFEFTAHDDPVALANNIRSVEARVAQMIEVLTKQRRTRGTRVVVTGFSQGGMLSYALALLHPALIDFAMPIGGLLPEPLWPDHPRGTTRSPRIHALHGAADVRVPLDTDARLVEHLNSRGYAAELTVFDGVGHAIAPAMSATAKAELSAALADRKH
jgi:phospholipase/carboxylesterase